MLKFRPIPGGYTLADIGEYLRDAHRLLEREFNEFLQASSMWKAWTPEFENVDGMEFSPSEVVYAEYMELGERVEFRISAAGTTSGSAAATIWVTPPVSPEYLGGEWFAAGAFDTSRRPGYAFFGSTGLIGVRKADSSNWGLGASRSIVVSGFYKRKVS